eukprot:g15030.t1
MAGLTSAEHGTLQVVCPSYGRTGTKSMQAALEILGFGPCYHMSRVWLHHRDNHAQLWLDGLQGRGLAVNEIFRGYKSVADFPASPFYKEILAANPDAKVVVTERDVDAWWKSFRSTINCNNPIRVGWGYFFLEVLFTDIRTLKHMLRHIKPLEMGEEEAKADYARHNAEVLAHVSPDKLLKFSVTDGWEPLCEFLEVPVPDVPFPKVNSTQDMIAMHKSVNMKGWLMMAATLTAAGASVAAASFFGGKRTGGVLAVTEATVLACRIRKAIAMRQPPSLRCKFVVPLTWGALVHCTMAGLTSAEHGTLQVVCPSYGRTGTKSMQAALEILGFGPCYHMTRVPLHNGDHHAELWIDGLQGRGLVVNEIFRGYKSVADFPASPFYKEILAANPDAKVVVTERDVDAWWKSFRSTINFNNPIRVGWAYFFLEVLFTDIRTFRYMLRNVKPLEMGEEEAKADYARHNAEVLAHVSPDKLLKFSVTDGWEPLCEFLEVPVPDVPFPKVNSTQDMIAMHKSVTIKGWLMMAATLTAAGASVAAASFFGGKRAGGALAVTEATVLACRIRKAIAMRQVEAGRKSSS